MGTNGLGQKVSSGVFLGTGKCRYATSVDLHAELYCTAPHRTALTPFGRALEGFCVGAPDVVSTTQLGRKSCCRQVGKEQVSTRCRTGQVLCVWFGLQEAK